MFEFAYRQLKNVQELVNILANVLIRKHSDISLTTPSVVLAQRLNNIRRPAPQEVKLIVAISIR